MRKLLSIIIACISILSCTAEEKSLKEFFKGDFVIDGPATREYVLANKKLVETLHGDAEAKIYIEKYTSPRIIQKCTMNVSENKIIINGLRTNRHFDYKIIEETTEKITLEVKEVLNVDVETKEEFIQDGKVNKITIYFYDKMKTSIGTSEESLSWYRIWKKP